MTLTSTITKASFAGNGSTTAFPFAFPFQHDADIKAVLVTTGVGSALIQGTHYTLSGAGESTGGTLTMLTAPDTGQTLVIWRAPAIVQEVDYVENSAFPAETHEGALDLLTMIAQGLQEQIDRSIKVPISSTVDPDSVIAQLEEDAATASNAASAAATQAQTATTQAQIAAQSATDAAASAVEAQAAVGSMADRALSNLTDDAVARSNLGLGSAALLTAGTAAHNAVQLDASAKLPAVDGSQLANLPIVLPPQAGKAGAVLKTDGLNAAWGNNWTFGPSATMTGLTSCTFTGVPAWATELVLFADAVSTNGSASVGVQVGTSAGLVTNDYYGSWGLAGANVFSGGTLSSMFAGYGSEAQGAELTRFVVCRLQKIIGTNFWFSDLKMSLSGGAKMWNALGKISVPGTLDRLALVQDGSDTFDAGTAIIAWR